MAGLVGPLVSGLVGAISGNIAQKAAAKNADNAQNIGLNRNQQAGAAATGALNNYWSQSPYFKMQAPTAPGQVSGAGSPSMQAPQPTAAPAGQGQAGGPPQAGAHPQGQIPPQLLAALQAALQGHGLPPQGGQPGQPQGMHLPQAPQSQGSPSVDIQALLRQFYGQGR